MRPYDHNHRPNGYNSESCGTKCACVQTLS